MVDNVVVSYHPTAHTTLIVHFKFSIDTASTEAILGGEEPRSLAQQGGQRR